jgi:hypothetical protein
MQKALEAMPAPGVSGPPLPPEVERVARAIVTGEQKYTAIRGPVLAIYAVPHSAPPAIANDATARAAYEASAGAQAKAFESGVPKAHVIRLAQANHYVFVSNEADVLREMNAFIGTLP